MGSGGFQSLIFTSKKLGTAAIKLKYAKVFDLKDNPIDIIVNVLVK